MDARSQDLKKKDSRHYFCINSVPNPTGPGKIYQFERKWCPISQEIEPSEPSYPKGVGLAEDGYWTWSGGFRGVYRRGWSCDRVEIPCPIALQHNLDRRFKIALVDGLLGDLEFATLTANNDLVIAEGSEFFHDMMGHVAFEICENPFSTRQWRMKHLRQALEFYTEWRRCCNNNLTLKILEFCFGLSADLGFPFDASLFNARLTSPGLEQRLFIQRFFCTAEMPVIISEHLTPFFLAFTETLNVAMEKELQSTMHEGDTYVKLSIKYV